MKTSHLKEWFAEFPNLRHLLSKEDKDILNKIDPVEYQYFNITRETEVVRIINDHKPQAWKWIKLYPSLRNLPAEDYAILDHIVPNDYLGEVTETDVRRIIAYRKAEIRKGKEKDKAMQAKQYYEDNKAGIEKEEKDRSRLTNIVKYSALAGVTLITSGIASPSPIHLGIGVGLIVLPLLASAIRLKKLDRNSVIPKPIERDDSKLDFLSVAFIILYYIGFIGMGITLGMFPVWELAGWDTAETVMFTGLSTIGASVILFLIAAVATPSKD